MPVINLEIQGKQAVGDGTKIVCMNGDYKVRIKCNNCDTFDELPVKKLILKTGFDYHESPITSVTENSKTYLQADLPIIDYTKSIELGVYGKETEDGEPKFTSQPAVFECVKSVLCGAVVLKKDPTLDSLTVRENGTYIAADSNVDGFHEVTVDVPGTPSEVRNVELSMAGGSQLIEPSTNDRLMSQVVVAKPIALTPSNIRAGISIGGVVGTYDKILTDTEIYADGEYTPPAGYDGFSKVKVNVQGVTYVKHLSVGEHFDYPYDDSVNIKMDRSGIVKYENTGESIIFTAIGKGTCTVILKDYDDGANLVNTLTFVITTVVETEKMLPAEADNVNTMERYLQEYAVGSVIKYTGATASGFVKNGLFIIEEGE